MNHLYREKSCLFPFSLLLNFYLCVCVIILNFIWSYFCIESLYDKKDICCVDNSWIGNTGVARGNRLRYDRAELNRRNSSLIYQTGSTEKNLFFLLKILTSCVTKYLLSFRKIYVFYNRIYFLISMKKKIRIQLNVKIEVYFRFKWARLHIHLLPHILNQYSKTFK